MPLASPAVREDGSTVEERLAVRLVREFEDVVHVERLEPPGSVPTPDWRVTTADGRVADVEVIWDTNEAGRWFESQLSEEHVDEDSLRRRPLRKEWHDPRLSMVWNARVYDDDPDTNRRPAKELVEALVKVLAEVEARGGTPEQMVEAAQNRLVEPQTHLDSHDWGTVWRQASARGVGFDTFMLRWGQRTGYWYPQLLVDYGETLPRRVRVLRASEPEGSDCGMVRTSPGVHDFAWGEYEHMLAAVQDCIDTKTEKRQMENAPCLKWLFVVLDDNMAAVQLDDHFGPEAPTLYPYDVLDTLTFDYFDEVWVTGRSFQARGHIVLRLFKSGDAPQHMVVPRAALPAS